ncbi:hypothetical protein [Zavarzinella formosa]|uniref:hypothetical protein n=1 Tax=Zavarzinella formosa TaxID=360055 RepID=UPI0012F8E457|nr:hypothetical protein [Zavarzinella formosa]
MDSISNRGKSRRSEQASQAPLNAASLRITGGLKTQAPLPSFAAFGRFSMRHITHQNHSFEKFGRQQPFSIHIGLIVV